MGLFSKDLAIDLGTSNTVIYAKGAGIVLREPSVVVIDKMTGKPYAVGNEANEMIGRTPDSIVAIKPLEDGVVADFDSAQIMLRSYLQSVNGNSLLKPRVLVCIPGNTTEVERRAVQEAALTSGARAVALIEEPIAAAVGAGVPVDEAQGSMVIDIGGGTTEVAVICLGGVVSSKSIRIGGDALDSAIINYVKKECNIIIGDKMAEEIKLAIGCAYAPEGNKVFVVRGRNVSTGLPAEYELTDVDICEAISENINQIVEAIKYTLENIPPELSSDILEKGVVLTGGGALLPGLTKLITDTLHIPAVVAEHPLDCVALGTARYLKDIRHILSEGTL